MSETTIVTTGTSAAEEVTAPVTDLAKDVGAHGAKLEAHDAKLLEHEERLARIDDRLDAAQRTAEAALSAPISDGGAVATTALDTAQEAVEKVEALEEKIEQQVGTTGTDASQIVQPPPAAEPPKKAGGFVAFLKRHI